MLKRYILYISFVFILTIKTYATDQEVMCHAFQEFKSCLISIKSYPYLAFWCRSLGEQTRPYKNVIKNLAIQQNRMTEWQDIQSHLKQCIKTSSVICAIVYSIKAMEFSEDLAQCHSNKTHENLYLNDF